MSHSVTPVLRGLLCKTDRIDILHKGKRKKTSEFLIKRKESVQEPDNTSKRAKENSIPDEEKHNRKITPPPFKNKEDSIGGTNEKTRESEDSPSETNGCARNLGKKYKYEEEE